MSIAIEEGNTYQSLQMVLQDAFGVVIGEGSSNSIFAKLKPVMAEFDLDSLDVLIAELQKDASSSLKNSVLQAVTTHEDAWFSPPALFNLLDDYLLADILESGRSKYRIWVIGCRAGQLPYSLAMRIHQAGKKANSSTQVTIEATDATASAVSIAAKGAYEPTSMSGMTDDSRKKYMAEKSGLWRVNDDIRSMVSFAAANLRDNIEDKGRFDLIICHDVLVYFAYPVKTALVESFANLLDPSGILVSSLNEQDLPPNEYFDTVHHDSGIFYRQKAS